MGPDVGLRGARRRPHGGHRTGSGWTRITPDRITATVARPPATLAAATGYRGRPRTGPDERQTRAVEHEREALAGRDRSQTAPQQPKKRLRSACVASA